MIRLIRINQAQKNRRPLRHISLTQPLRRRRQTARRLPRLLPFLPFTINRFKRPQNAARLQRTIRVSFRNATRHRPLKNLARTRFNRAF